MEYVHSSANPRTQAFGYVEFINGHMKYSSKYSRIIDSCLAKSPAVGIKYPSQRHYCLENIKHELTQFVQWHTSIIGEADK
jgi:hypothetical protein